ncbi:MAG: LysR substrate-binding domain-containing protein [Pseudobdellovibrionaceae bacterium]
MEIESIRIFVKVVQLGSFSKAAEVLRLPKSTVSRTVSGLEKETSTKLLLRTTRSLTLTAGGRAFYESCLGPVQILEDARKSLHGQDSILSGLIRLTAPEDLGAYVISPTIGEISKQNPDLFFDINYTDQVIDLVKEGYDIAIRIGKLNPSSFKATRLAEIVLVPVASPEYLKMKSKIKTPNDLSDHPCLTYRLNSINPKWQLYSKKGSKSVSIKASVTSNQMTSLMNIAMSGAGIGLLPHYLCQKHIEESRLVRILPDWTGTSFPFWMVTPMSTSSSARLKLTADRLADSIRRKLSAL